MANTTRISPLGAIAPFNLGVNARSTIALEGDVRTLAVQVALTGTVTIGTAAATRILSGGTLAAAISEIGIVEAGEDILVMDGRSALALSIATNESDADLGASRLTALGTGATVLRETLWLPITLTRSLSPIETALQQVRRGSGVEFSVFVKVPTTDMNGILVTPGASGTATLSAVSAEVLQVVDTSAGVPSIFLPRVRQVSRTITSAGRERMSLSSSQFIRGLLIQQSAGGVGDVSDIIQRLVLRNDARSFIGDQSAAYRDVIAINDRVNLGGLITHGGVALGGGTYAFIDFASNGRLSELLNPLAAPNLRLDLDVTPSATVGATSSSVRVTLLEYITAAGVTAPPPFQV